MKVTFFLFMTDNDAPGFRSVEEVESNSDPEMCALGAKLCEQHGYNQYSYEDGDVEWE